MENAFVNYCTPKVILFILRSVPSFELEYIHTALHRSLLALAVSTVGQAIMEEHNLCSGPKIKNCFFERKSTTKTTYNIYAKKKKKKTQHLQYILRSTVALYISASLCSRLLCGYKKSDVFFPTNTVFPRNGEREKAVWPDPAKNIYGNASPRVSKNGGKESYAVKAPRFFRKNPPQRAQISLKLALGTRAVLDQYTAPKLYLSISKIPGISGTQGVLQSWPMFSLFFCPLFSSPIFFCNFVLLI